MKHFQLKPDSQLLNPDFEGYKLCLDPLPSYPTPLERQTPLQVHLDNSQYSVQHLKTYGSRSCLVLNPWSQSLLYVDREGVIFESRLRDGKISFSEVFRLSRPDHGFTTPPSLLFGSPTLAVVCDSRRIFLCRLCGGDGGGGGGVGLWSELKMCDDQIFLDDCVLMDSYDDGAVCHVVLQRVKRVEEERMEVLREEGAEDGAIADDSAKNCESKTSAFCSELIWIAWELHEDVYKKSFDVRLESSSSAEFVAIDRSGRFLNITSQNPFRLTCPVKAEEPTPMEAEGASIASPLPPYVWSQTTEEVTLSFLVGKEVTKRDICFSLAGSKIEIRLADGKTLLSGDLEGKIDKDGCSWTLGDSILEVTLEKSQLCVWDRVVEGDATPETRSDSAHDAAAIHESLKHLTTDSWNAEPDKPFQPFNTQELEECDFGGGETSYLSAFDRQELRFHSQSSISSNHILFSMPSMETNACPMLCLRHDVDAILWQPTQGKEFLNRPYKHLASLHALGYVSASKTRRRFLTSSSDFSYAVIADVDRHVYVYRQNCQLENADLRNRKSGKRTSSIAQQQVFSLKNNAEILGVVALPDNLFILTADTFIRVAISEKQ